MIRYKIFPVVNVDSYHPPLEISCIVSLIKNKDLKYNESVYDWEKANYYQIHLSLASINWFAHYNFKYLKSYSNYTKFSNLRTKYKNLRHIDYSTYLKNVKNNVISNPKYFWKFIQ
ncbi:Uncharacterized protein FWK35_00022361 [Aphis craccivora]|uniref:Uncharacterized protein n=1 Tax=Aphis craccivora TaxID=307492 RepID=A0A6G0W3B5_APHCR|nr:Uncharacterized protein FWK35_00022361 [Aphis craccivora]